MNLQIGCHFLKGDTEKGIPQKPISINFSKAHLTNGNLEEQIFHTVKHVGIAAEMIEIEFAEIQERC